MLLMSWGTKDGGSMTGLFEEHLNTAAQTRFNMLMATIGTPKGALAGSQQALQALSCLYIQSSQWHVRIFSSILEITSTAQ